MTIKLELKYSRLLLLIGLLLFSLSISAQVRNNGNGNGNGEKHLTVTSTGSLEFGRFSKQQGGTISIDPSGSVITTGDIFLLNSLRRTVEFTVSTNQGTSNVIQIIPPLPISLAGPAGSSLDLSVFFDKDNFTINKWNPETILMGGTLIIGSEDLSGFYTGTVTITFAYQ